MVGQHAGPPPQNICNSRPDTDPHISSTTSPAFSPKPAPLPCDICCSQRGAATTTIRHMMSCDHGDFQHAGCPIDHHGCQRAGFHHVHGTTGREGWERRTSEAEVTRDEDPLPVPLRVGPEKPQVAANELTITNCHHHHHGCQRAGSHTHQWNDDTTPHAA